jgi:hypothetical protein
MTARNRLAAGRRVLAVAVLMLGLVGCGSRTESDSGKTLIASADDVLQQMVQTYAAADSYRDRGLIRLKYRVDDQWVCDDGQFAVRFARPNRLYLRAYQLTLASDAEQLRAIVADQQTGDLDGQVLVRTTPASLHLDDLYEDPIVLKTVAGGMGGPPLTLELLLGERPLHEVFQPTTPRQMLDDGEIRGHACYRIQAQLPEGALVFWIDRESYILRRLEYPADRLAEQMAQGMNCSEVTLTAEFRDAMIGTTLYESEFAFQAPQGARLVSRFVVPPQPLPSDLLGRLPGEFFFVDLDGRQVPRQSLLGHTAVLIWFNDHPASQAALAQLEPLRQQYADQSQIRLIAVCTEPTHVGNSELEALAARWGTSIPMVRDLEAFGRDIFQVPWAPTLVILDRRGVVQAFAVGANPELSEQVGSVLQQLLEGKDLAAEALAGYERAQAAYARQLAEVGVTDVQLPAPTAQDDQTQHRSAEAVGSRGAAPALVPLSLPGRRGGDAAGIRGDGR